MPEPKIRYHYIDWMRIIAFSVLIFLHSMLPFTSIPWEIKNDENSYLLTTFTGWLHQWRLPLLFFVSGMGISFSMASRSLLSFYGERFRRLFIPLLFAMFFTIPLQPYFEFLQKGKIQEGYFSFYSRVWDLEIYPQGPLTWSHMWFVVYLIAFILLLLPLFGLLKLRVMSSVRQKCSEALGHPVSMVLMVLPLMYIFYSLFLKYPENGSLTEDWFAFSFFICFLVYGYFIGSSKRFWENAEKYRWLAGIIALVCIVILFAKYWKPLAEFKTEDRNFLLYTILNCIHIWSIIIFFCGMARKHLNFKTPALEYLNKAVYPYYIIHQTIIVVIGYYLVKMEQPIIVKFPLLLLLSTAAILGVYHFLIRPTRLTRFLFGMK